jgi:acetylornithine deacetylase/succinyl-diaminopimelate desuccinylase-like protein
VTDEDFRESLRRLVALDTVSPMSPERLAATGVELARHGCRRIGDELFGYGDPGAPVWLYGHVDTKPVGPARAWSTDPFRLTDRDGYWFGLGVSDSKFQLLNALALADRARHFVLVDTSEESDGSGAAGEYVAAHAPSALVICDGARTDTDVYLGYRGQADGVVELDTGRPVRHPACGDGDVTPLLRRLLAAVEASGLRFALTGLSAPETERSLTVQRARVRFDIRFGPDEEPAVRAFLADWPHTLRQWMWPVCGTEPVELDGLSCGALAPFSNRLGQRDPLPVRRLVVVPGADPDNRNHEPDEFIRPAQVGRHRETLRRVLRALEPSETAGAVGVPARLDRGGDQHA